MSLLRLPGIGAGGLLLLSALLLTGCDHDRPVLAQAPTVRQYGPSTPRVDALVGSSGGGGGGGGASSSSGPDTPAAPEVNAPPDPLLGTTHADQSPNDPLAPPDPLATADPLKGPVMPTQHSHWLDTEMGQARVTVRLNGIRVGGFMTSGVRDVTMRLRPGVNTLSVTYEPRNVHSWASVVMTEGENGPSGKLLAEFHEVPLADTTGGAESSQAPPPPVIRTIVFTAR